jgi:hypothetical protein
MGIFALGIEHPLDMTVQCLHEPDPRHHHRTASRYQQQDLDRRLPCRQVGFRFRQLRDVVGRVFECDKLATVRKRYRILELSLPAVVSHQANNSAPAGVNFT